MPEPFIISEHEDAAKKDEQIKSDQDNSVYTRATGKERMIQMAKDQSEEEYLTGALNTEVVDREEQAHTLERFEREKKQYFSPSRPIFDPYMCMPFDSQPMVACLFSVRTK